MGKATLATSETSLQSAGAKLRAANWERLGILYARIALSAAFL